MATVIGITGGIASGKSLVTKRLKELTYLVVDCDEISHKVFEEEKTKKAIALNLNINYNEVTRSNISKIVFNDSRKLTLLNNVMQPLIKKDLKKIMTELRNEKIYFVDVPLLYEEKMEKMFDDIILVMVDEAIQIKRLMDRDHISYDFALSKINKQIPLKEKKRNALKNHNYIINNNGIIEDTYEQIDKILKEINNDI